MENNKDFIETNKSKPKTPEETPEQIKEREEREEDYYQHIRDMLKTGPLRFPVKVQYNNRQYVLALPSKFAKGLRVRKGDTFIFEIKLNENENGKIKDSIQYIEELSKRMNENRLKG